jgi:hypothetical protein
MARASASESVKVFSPSEERDGHLVARCHIECPLLPRREYLNDLEVNGRVRNQFREEVVELFSRGSGGRVPFPGRRVQFGWADTGHPRLHCDLGEDRQLLNRDIEGSMVTATAPDAVGGRSRFAAPGLSRSILTDGRLGRSVGSPLRVGGSGPLRRGRPTAGSGQHCRRGQHDGDPALARHGLR